MKLILAIVSSDDSQAVSSSLKTGTIVKNLSTTYDYWNIDFSELQSTITRIKTGWQFNS